MVVSVVWACVSGWGPSYCVPSQGAARAQLPRAWLEGARGESFGSNKVSYGRIQLSILPLVRLLVQ